MAYGKFSKQYKRSNIETAGKLDLIIMCYETAILCLTQVKVHIKDKNVEKKAYKLQKAINIITELQCWLNMEKGGLIAKNLDSLYTYLIKRLLVADIQKDETAYDESIRILSELKEAWQAIKSQEDQSEDVYANRDVHESYNPRLTAY
jgi:flagellar protein FliS